MTRPRSARLLVAALGFGALLLPAGPAAATPKATQVAIVIAGHGVGCVKWHPGITGDQVLNDRASVSYRSDGVIVAIDGSPKSGKADDTHYWSYWHDTGNGWVYSSAGASGSQPAAGTVEGWSYDNGSAQPPRPPAVSYRAACGSKDPKPAPPPVRRTTAHPPPARSHGRTSALHSSAPRRATAPSTTAAHQAGRSRAAPSKVVASTPTRTTPTVRAYPVSGTGSLTPLARPAQHDSGGSAGPVLAGIGLVVVIGAGAGWTALRRRRAA